MSPLPSPYRTPRCGAPRSRATDPLDRGLRASLVVLVAWAALRVSSGIPRAQLDSEVAIAALVLAFALHALARRQPSR